MFLSQVVLQIFLGPTTLPALLATTQSVKSPEQDRKRFYAAAATLTIIEIFAMRCNVVIGGQLFSVTVHDRS